jgi:hypothetical protein
MWRRRRRRLASALAATVRRNAGSLTKEGSWTTKPRKNI